MGTHCVLRMIAWLGHTCDERRDLQLRPVGGALEGEFSVIIPGLDIGNACNRVALDSFSQIRNVLFARHGCQWMRVGWAFAWLVEAVWGILYATCGA